MFRNRQTKMQPTPYDQVDPFQVDSWSGDLSECSLSASTRDDSTAAETPFTPPTTLRSIRCQANKIRNQLRRDQEARIVERRKTKGTSRRENGDKLLTDYSHHAMAMMKVAGTSSRTRKLLSSNRRSTRRLSVSDSASTPIGSSIKV